MRVTMIGGPVAGRVYRYPEPLPDVLVICHHDGTRCAYHDYARVKDTATYTYWGRTADTSTQAYKPVENDAMT